MRKVGVSKAKPGNKAGNEIDFLSELFQINQ